MTQSLYPNAISVVSSAHMGKPAKQLLSRQAWAGADLVVVGKSRSNVIVDRLLGSTAHELLAQSRCDVMVVPDDFTLSTTRMSAQTMLATRDVPGLRAWSVSKGEYDA